MCTGPTTMAMKLIALCFIAFIKFISAQDITEYNDINCYQNIIKLNCQNQDRITVDPQERFVQVGAKKYIVSSEKRVSWFEAADICRVHNAQLVNIENEEEWAALSGYLISRGLRQMYWTSANALRGDRNFVWGETGRRMTYGKWRGGEPNNYNNQEHCIHLMEYALRYEMVDNHCQSTFDYVCEERAATNYVTSPKLNSPSEPFVKIGNNHYIINSSDRLNWIQAADWCRGYNAKLANIESEREFIFLTKYLREKSLERNLYWLSGNNLRKPSVWLWGDTGVPMTYNKWREGEPNNFGNSENCAQLETYLGNFDMIDGNCLATAFFICVW